MNAPDFPLDVLALAPVQPGEPPMKQIAVWDGFRTKAEKLKATAETLTITDASDRAGMALAALRNVTAEVSDGGRPSA